TGIYTDPERAHVVGTLAAPGVQRDPPDETAQRARDTAEHQGAAEAAYRLDGLFFEPTQVRIELGQVERFRATDRGEEHGLFVPAAAFDGHRDDVDRVFVQVRPRKVQVASP